MCLGLLSRSVPTIAPPRVAFAQSKAIGALWSFHAMGLCKTAHVHVHMCGSLIGRPPTGRSASQYAVTGSRAPGSGLRAPGSRLPVPGSRSRFAARGSRFRLAVPGSGSRFAVRGSRLSVRGSRLAAPGPRLAARGSRFAARGSRLAVRGSRLAARGSRLAATPPTTSQPTQLPVPQKACPLRSSTDRVRKWSSIAAHASVAVACPQRCRSDEPGDTRACTASIRGRRSTWRCPGE